jgi:hypothetical protein
MGWQSVEAVPITVGPPVSAARAAGVRAALLARAVPLARRVEGRVQPLATATLVEGRRLAVLTAAHVFDHAAVGDLMVPLPGTGVWLPLLDARPRVLVHPQRDLALIELAEGAVARRLRAHWRPLPAAECSDPPCDSARVYAVLGYPVSQSRRVDGTVYMKPLVLFTHALADDRLAYARTAPRVDGVEVHTPELEGVSGALVWAVHEAGPHGDCRLYPAAVQVAFMHGGYVRTEPLRAAPALLERLRA